jgi:riboflavin synthase
MFTGLIQDVAGVIDTARQGDSLRLVLATKMPRERFELGASVACNGVCLTVVALHDVPATGETFLEFDAGPETLRLSRLGSLQKGDGVNIEPALRVGDPLGGHDVSGHVDGCVRVHSSREWSDAFWRLELEIPASARRWILHKGSVCVRGVSLTVAELTDTPDGGAVCGIMLVPHTLSHTNLETCAAGHWVEVEYDKQVKMAATLLEALLPEMLRSALKDSK